jgi:hypothetical protein
MFVLKKQKKISNSFFRTKLNKGFAALFITILVLVIFFGIAVSVTILTLGEQKISRNIITSSQAYYAAEAGIEDALLRLAKIKNWSNLYNFSINDNTITVEISDAIGGSRTITAEGNVDERVRKVSVVYAVTVDKISFHYGAQVGNGGMIMEPNSKVIGNVFSNGTVVCPDPLGKAFITNNITVARNGQKIERLEVGDPDPLTPIDEARAHTCVGCLIHGNLYYVSEGGGNPGDCVAEEEIKSLPTEISSEELPVSGEKIQNWKDEASCNDNPSCIFSGDYTIPGGETREIGPLKIEGNLTLENNATLKMTGTIYVTDNIILNQNSTVELDPNDYGSLSGLIIADGKINVENNAIIQGSGQEGSYTMLVSTDSSLDENDAAIDVKNSAMGAVFYTANGVMRLRNNMKIREATGYKIYLDNNAEIEYETGLEEATFTSGPGGSWEVVSWREIP